MSLFAETVTAIAPPDEAAREAARERLDRMTMPRGALGRVGDAQPYFSYVQGAADPGLL